MNMNSVRNAYITLLDKVTTILCYSAELSTNKMNAGKPIPSVLED